MLHLLDTAALTAAEGGHHINEELHSLAPVIGVLAFVGFVLLMIISFSFSSRRKSPAVGEYEDPSALSPAEQEMLGHVGSSGHH